MNAVPKILTQLVGDKRRWRAYKKRKEALPATYRTAVDAIERYVMFFGPADGERAATMFEDLADLFEQAAAEVTPIHAIVGDDPVEFVEAFVRNYAGGGYIDRERTRLLDALARAEDEEGDTR